MNWDNFENSCQMYTLLLDWKEIPVHTALQVYETYIVSTVIPIRAS